MNCPICFDEITVDSGQVTTSCKHTFHFKCLNTWYYRQLQNEDGEESCPCCRTKPGEYERASVVSESTESDAESQSIEFTPSHFTNTEWVRIGPRRWVIPSSDEDRLRILANLASERVKDPLEIPAFSEEAHALWVLRHLFEAPPEPAGPPQEPVDIMDRPKMLRKRGLYQGRTFWAHIGNGYNLDYTDRGYKSD